MANCCTECFLDDYLKERIKEKGALGKCDFCNSKNVYVVNPRELRSYFGSLIGLYSAQVEFYPVDLLKECEGRFIWEILSEDWGVFDVPEEGEQIIKAMYRSGDPHHDESPLFLDNYVDSQDEFYGTEHEISDRLKEQWKDFCKEIIYRNRFFPQKKLDAELICEILSYSESIISKGVCLFRARQSEDILSPKEMGPPPNTEAVAGRANPKWIPYLYLASNPNTAISETRPHVQDRITVGTFRANEQIKVIDLRNPYIDTPFRWGDRLRFVLDIYAFLRMLGDILSKPVRRNQAELEYLPTQYLCEFMKNQGYEGVLYKSFLGDEHNIVLFDGQKVECIDTKLYKVASIKVQSDEIREQ